MSNENLNQGSISSLEYEARVVTKTLDEFFQILKEPYNIGFSNPKKQNMLKMVRTQYKEHRDIYRGVYYVTSGDVFKIVSWAAMFLCDDKPQKKEQILEAACTYMNECLKDIKRTIPDKIIIEIVAMLCNDGGKNDRFAIGKNGLYMAFKCASEAGLQTDKHTPSTPSA